MRKRSGNEEGRHPFTEADREAMVAFVEGRQGNAGARLWEEAEALRVTSHPAESMRNHWNRSLSHVRTKYVRKMREAEGKKAAERLGFLQEQFEHVDLRAVRWMREMRRDYGVSDIACVELLAQTDGRPALAEEVIKTVIREGDAGTVPIGTIWSPEAISRAQTKMIRASMCPTGEDGV